MGNLRREKGVSDRVALLDSGEAGRGRRAHPAEQERRVAFYLTPHAKERMGERGIVDKDVRIALERPDALEPCRGRRAVARKYCGARTLEIVFSTEGTLAIVQTAYWLERTG